MSMLFGKSRLTSFSNRVLIEMKKTGKRQFIHLISKILSMRGTV
jgi:hypothetical protein